MTSPVRAASGRRGRRGPLQVAAGAVAFVAVVGSVVVAFTDDSRLLKLALVAVLWVAVAALFVVEHMRRRADTAVARTADLRAVYELELEREVRARREQELATEREVRERVTAQVRDEGRLELDELREELKALRDNLSMLLSGDLLVERVALRAESTRLRSLTDTARLESGGAAQLAGAPRAVDLLDAETVEHPATDPATPGAPARNAEAPQTAEIEVLDEPAAEEPVAEVAEEPAPAVAAVAGVAEEPAPDAPAAEVPAEPVVDRGGDAPTEVFAAVAPEPRSETVAPAPPVVTAPTVNTEPVVTESVVSVPTEPAPTEPEPAEVGAHSAGRSVSDLLAAYGGGGSGGRRRRRSED